MKRIHLLFLCAIFFHFWLTPSTFAMSSKKNCALLLRGDAVTESIGEDVFDLSDGSRVHLSVNRQTGVLILKNERTGESHTFSVEEYILKIANGQTLAHLLKENEIELSSSDALIEKVELIHNPKTGKQLLVLDLVGGQNIEVDPLTGKGLFKDDLIALAKNKEEFISSTGTVSVVGLDFEGMPQWATHENQGEILYDAKHPEAPQSPKRPTAEELRELIDSDRQFDLAIALSDEGNRLGFCADLAKRSASISDKYLYTLIHRASNPHFRKQVIEVFRHNPVLANIVGIWGSWNDTVDAYEEKLDAQIKKSVPSGPLN